MDSCYCISIVGNRDPDFRYCADTVTSGYFNGYMMNACDLQEASSGGPWFYPFGLTNGFGSIISVNSYGYSDQVPSGMGGPKLFGNSAKCLFDVANSYPLNAPDNGYVVDFTGGCPLVNALSPTIAPTDQPTDQPNALSPTIPPTDQPHAWSPTIPPTDQPTEQPTTTPTQAPIEHPAPSAGPTIAPTKRPTSQPTRSPQCIQSQRNCNNASVKCCENEYCSSFTGTKKKSEKNSGKGKGKVQKTINFTYFQCVLRKGRNAKCETNSECESRNCKKKRCS